MKTNTHFFRLALLWCGLQSLLLAQTDGRGIESASNARMPYLPQMIAASNDPEESLDAYFSGLSENEIVTPQNWELIRKYGITKDGNTIQTLLEYRTEFAALVSPAAVDSHLYRIFSREVEYEDPTNDKNMLALRSEMKQLNFTGASILCDRLDIIRLKEADEFAVLTDLVSGKYFIETNLKEETASLLLYTAQNFACSRMPDRLDFAAQCAAKSAEIWPTYEAMTEHVMILFRLKKTDLALAACDQAIGWGKKQGINTGELEALAAEVRGTPKAGTAIGYVIENGYISFEFDPKQYQLSLNERGRVVVPISALTVERVSVIGDFNEWESGSWELVADGGKYILRKELAAFAKKKEWTFRFVINGQYHVLPPTDAPNKKIRYESCEILKDISLLLTK